jgi:hypothetical protein
MCCKASGTQQIGKGVFLFSILCGLLMCSSAYSQSVVIYEHANFAGRSQSLGVGNHVLSDLNDAASSIKVPAGFVAMVFESAESKGGYGIWVDFLEDQPDLVKYDFNDKVSYVRVFEAKRPPGWIWARNSMRSGVFMAGHWERPRANTPPNTVAVVGPPVPPRDPTGPVTNQGFPILNDIVKKIKAIPDFPGTVTPGQTLNVTLNLPAELGGPGPLRRGPSAGRRSLTDVIPCDALPKGCPAPIPLPTEPGTPKAQLDLLSVQLKWWVFESAFPRERPGAPLAEGKDFISPTGQGLSRAFVMAPLQIVEYKDAPVPTTRYMIVATVSVTANKTVLSTPSAITKVSSADIPVILPLSLSALPIPKVFVLFMGANFTEAAAIYLPANSPLNHGTLTNGASKLLQTYEGVATKLDFVAWFGSYVFGLKALDALGKTSMTVPHIDVKELKNAEPNLNNDDFIHKSPVTSVNDKEVEDESSSLLMLGPPNTEVRFFQRRDYEGGAFSVQTGVLKDYAPFVAVHNFVNMKSQPGGRATIVRKFYGTRIPIPPSVPEISPNDQLSSFKWVR